MRRFGVIAVCAGLLLAGCSDESLDEVDEAGTPPNAARVVLAATAYDGGPPSSEDLEAARDIVAERIGDPDASVEVDGDTLVVVIPDDPDGSAAAAFGRTGRLVVRPVLATSWSSGTTVPALADRQSTDPAIQNRALADIDCTRKDPLRGEDDPDLPLVTCDADGEAYLLGPRVFDGTQIVDAAARADKTVDLQVVDIRFADASATAWADFTADNVGAQVAFTLDSRVLNAPVVQASIPAGSATTISGRFTAEEAEALAATLRSGALPVLLSVR